MSHCATILDRYLDTTGHSKDDCLEVPSWQRLWCVVRQGTYLSYYDAENSAKPRGVINLDAYCCTEREGPDDQQRAGRAKRALRHFVTGDADARMRDVMRSGRNASFKEEDDGVGSGGSELSTPGAGAGSGGAVQASHAAAPTGDFRFNISDPAQGTSRIFNWCCVSEADLDGWLGALQTETFQEVVAQRSALQGANDAMEKELEQAKRVLHPPRPARPLCDRPTGFPGHAPRKRPADY
jgi:hypothetical protein